jgi:ferrous iron transport protein A
MDSKHTLADLKPGETGVIKGFDDEELSLKLLEMGCLPGASVTMSHSAPLGCPICINVGGCLLSLRKEEAAEVLLQYINK